MKTIIKGLAPAVLFAVCLSVPQEAAQGQENFWGVAYTTGLTSGDASDYIDSFSWRGIEVNYRR